VNTPRPGSATGGPAWWQLAASTKTAIDAHPSTAAAAVLVVLGCLAAAVIVVLVADYVI
jgi:hypothetical protein